MEWFMVELIKSPPTYRQVGLPLFAKEGNKDGELPTQLREDR